MPILALPSLQELRHLLAEGIVLLDCQAQSLLELVGRLRKTFHFLGISPKVLESSRAYPIPILPQVLPVSVSQIVMVAVAHICNLSTWQAEAGGSLKTRQLGLCSETLSQNGVCGRG